MATQAAQGSSIVGSFVWVEDPEEAWMDGEVVEVNGEDITVNCASGKMKPGGIIALLDEACMFPRSTHETFAEKLYQTFKDHKHFSKPKLARSDFTICHYAGDGVIEAIRISCAGYPTRKTFDEFACCFAILAPDVLHGSCDEVSACKRLLEKAKLEGYQIDKTKLFLRAGQMAELHAR